MDNLTHSLVGLFLARSGFRRVSARATAVMMVAANIPDLDAVSMLAGSATYLRWHRNITHSLIAIPVMALLSVALVAVFSKGRNLRWLPCWGAAIVAVISHVLLDLTNVYGVRLQLPFSGEWTHWDTVPVIDLAIWAILLLGVAAPFLSRLVNSELGVRDRGVGAEWAICSLLMLTGYDWARRDLHNYVVKQLEARTYNGLGARRVGAFPHPNPLQWEGVAELSYGYVILPLNVAVNMQGTPDVSQQVTFYKGERDARVLAALKTEPFVHLQEFVQWPLWMSVPSPADPTLTRVTLFDLRFGRPSDAGFAAVATVSKSAQVVDSEFSIGRIRLK